MSQVTSSVSKLSRSIGSVASRPAAYSSGPSLLPKYAELLRNRQMPKEQSDAHSHARQMTTRHIPATPQPNPISLPSHAQFSPSGRRTPVPILFTPSQQAADSGPEPAHTPTVHFVAQNQKDAQKDGLEGIEAIDVDEAALKAKARTS